MQQNEVVGSVEAGRIIGKSTRTVHRLVADGTLTPILTTPGGAHGAFLFNREDVEQLAATAGAA